MAEIGLRSPMLVRDVMSSPPITVDEDTPADQVAQALKEHRVGCVIVTGKEGKPLGIITERDLVLRVLAKNLIPSQVTAKEVMSSPLMTINPSETLTEAARRMSRLNIRRLGVVYKGRLVGIISSKDILAIMPELMETMQEKARIESANLEETLESSSLAGYCDNCGMWSDDLKEVEGQFLCVDCRTELEEE